MAFESLILDARGNPFQGSIDAIGGETITDSRVASATLGALNAEIIMDIQGKATAFVFAAAVAVTWLLDVKGLDKISWVAAVARAVTTQFPLVYALTLQRTRRQPIQITEYTDACVVVIITDAA